MRVAIVPCSRRKFSPRWGEMLVEEAAEGQKEEEEEEEEEEEQLEHIARGEVVIKPHAVLCLQSIIDNIFFLHTC